MATSKKQRTKKKRKKKGRPAREPAKRPSLAEIAAAEAETSRRRGAARHLSPPALPTLDGAAVHQVLDADQERLLGALSGSNPEVGYQLSTPRGDVTMYFRVRRGVTSADLWRQGAAALLADPALRSSFASRFGGMADATDAADVQQLIVEAVTDDPEWVLDMWDSNQVLVEATLCAGVEAVGADLAGGRVWVPVAYTRQLAAVNPAARPRPTFHIGRIPEAIQKPLSAFVRQVAGGGGVRDAVAAFCAGPSTSGGGVPGDGDLREGLPGSPGDARLGVHGQPDGGLPPAREAREDAPEAQQLRGARDPLDGAVPPDVVIHDLRPRPAPAPAARERAVPAATDDAAPTGGEE